MKNAISFDKWCVSDALTVVEEEFDILSPSNSGTLGVLTMWRELCACTPPNPFCPPALFAHQIGHPLLLFHHQLSFVNNINPCLQTSIIGLWFFIPSFANALNANCEFGIYSGTYHSCLAESGVKTTAPPSRDNGVLSSDRVTTVQMMDTLFRTKQSYREVDPSDQDEGGIRQTFMTSQRGFFTRHAHSFLTAFLALALVWSLSGRGPPPPPIASPFNHGFRPSHGPEVDAAAFFKNLFAPLVHRELAIPPTYLSDITNKTKTLSYAGEPVWKEPLGKEVLILDLDTRAFDGSNRLLHDGSVAWEDMERSSAGILNHYMYCELHLHRQP